MRWTSRRRRTCPTAVCAQSNTSVSCSRRRARAASVCESQRRFAGTGRGSRRPTGEEDDMRPVAGAIVLAIALRLPQSEAVVTLAQRDEWRSYSDASSAAVSADGRYVAFASYAQLVPADLNRVRDIYVLDRTEGGVTL